MFYSGQNIESNKIILHSRFCSINVKRCSICNEPVTIDDIENHNKLKHIDVECEFCHKKFKPDIIEEHKEKCEDKLEVCKYCELNISKKENKQHEYICG